jgi:Glycosyltransferase family 87
MLNWQTIKIPNLSRIQWFLIVLACLYFLKVYNTDVGDFRSYYHAGTKVREGFSPYYFYLPDEGWVSMFSYPPFFALLMLPFSLLPMGLSSLIWNVLSLAALFRVYSLIEGFLDIKKRLNLLLYRFFVFLTILFTVRFFLYNFDLTQSTLIVMWGTLEGLKLIKNEKFILGSLLLAGVISIKLLPLVVLPYLIYRAYFKEAILTVFFIFFLNILPIFIYGKDGYWQILNEWFRIINPTNLEFTLNQNAGDESTHGLSAFVPAFFSDSTLRYGLRRHFFALNSSQIIGLLLGFRLFFIALTLYFLRSKPFKKTVSNTQFMWEVSYLLMVIPLLFPQQMKYAFALLLPAFSYIIFYIMRMKRGTKFRILIGLMSLVFLLTTATTDGIIGKQFYQYAQYYKLITWGNFLLIFTLALCLPPPVSADSSAEDLAKVV